MASRSFVVPVNGGGSTIEKALQERVAALEAQVATLQRIATLENHVAALQQQSPPPSPPGADQVAASAAADGQARGSAKAPAAARPPSVKVMASIGEDAPAKETKQSRGRSLSSRPRLQFHSSTTSEMRTTSFRPQMRERSVTSARDRERAEKEQKIREYRATLANHADFLARREVEAVNRSFEEDRAGRRCPVINPYDSTIRWWEVAITSVLCFQAVEMPLRLAFEGWIYSLPTLVVCRWLELVVDVLFMCDLVLNFFISYLDEDMHVVTDHRRIACQYLRSWFLVDLLGGFPVDACFPMYWLELTNADPLESAIATTSGSPYASATNLLKTLKLSRLFKMLKLVKLGFRILKLARKSRARHGLIVNASSVTERVVEHLFGWIHPFAWTVMKQLVLFLFLVHIFACIQFTLSDATGFFPECAGSGVSAHALDDDERTCWLYRTRVPVVPTTLPALNASTIDGGDVYAAAFFHTAVQMLNGEVGLGGDPEFTHEIVLVFISSLVGFFWQASIVASITAFLDHVEKAGKHYRENVDRLRQYVKRHRLPHELRERLLLYYRVRYPDGRFFDDRSVIEDLSRPLQLEIREHLAKPVLDHLKLTAGSRLSQTLAEALTYRLFVTGARVIQQGNPPGSMFFVLSGKAKVVIANDQGEETELAILDEGETFGQQAVISKFEASPSSVVVKNLMEAFELPAETFEAICKFEPGFRQTIEESSQEKMTPQPGRYNQLLTVLESRAKQNTSPDGGAKENTGRWRKVRNANTFVMGVKAAASLAASADHRLSTLPAKADTDRRSSAGSVKSVTADQPEGSSPLGTPTSTKSNTPKWDAMKRGSSCGRDERVEGSPSETQPEPPSPAREPHRKPSGESSFAHEQQLSDRL